MLFSVWYHPGRLLERDGRFADMDAEYGARSLVSVLQAQGVTPTTSVLLEHRIGRYRGTWDGVYTVSWLQDPVPFSWTCYSSQDLGVEVQLS